MANGNATADSGIDAFATRDICRVGGMTLTLRALELCKFALGARIADIGCGKGVTVRWLREAGFDAHGLDSDEAAVSQAGEYCQKGDARLMPYEAGSMEGIFFECSLSEMSKPYEVLREARRVLRRGGKIAVSDLYARNDEFSGELTTRAQWLKLLADANFSCLSFEDRSDCLKALNAQLIWRYGREIPEEFYCRSDATTLRAARCGYFLMTARKAD